MTAKEIEHKGFTIRATPYKRDGQYQTSGTVAKEIGGVVKEHNSSAPTGSRGSTTRSRCRSPRAASSSTSRARRSSIDVGRRIRLFGNGLELGEPLLVVRANPLVEHQPEPARGDAVELALEAPCRLGACA